jgi:hypothetical protein
MSQRTETKCNAFYNSLMAIGSWRPQTLWDTPLVAPAAALGLGVAIGAVAVLASPFLALASLLGATVVLAILREPALGMYGLVALAFLLPFAVVPARIGLQLTALDAILGLTIGATLLRALTRREKPALDVVTWLFVAVLGLALVSFILSLPFTGSSAEISRRLLKLFATMLLFPLTQRLVRNRRRLDGLLVAIMVFGAIEAALACVFYFLPRDTTVRLLSSLGPLGYPTGPDILRFLPGENDTFTDVLRATGTSIDPNVLGGELLLAGAVLLSQLFSAAPRLPRWLLAPMSALVVLGMLVSHSRSSWVGLAVALLALATLRYRKLWLALAPAAVAVAVLPAGRALYARVLSGFGGQDKAAGMRLDEYRNALEIISQHPLFGIGFGGAPAIDLAPGVSSQYLTVAETAGLPALLLYLAALALLLLPAARALLMTRLEAGLQTSLASLLTAVIAALVAGLFDHYFASTVFPHMVALFWLCCGLLWRAVRLSREAGGPATPQSDI